jgi:glycosyltransferase involved in cell wall biosynthesis
MRILSIIHGYPPTWNAGSEWMIHQMNLWFMERGHQCMVMTNNNRFPSFEGVEILDGNDYRIAKKIGNICDVIMTHHNFTTIAMNEGLNFRKPVFYIQHSKVERPEIRQYNQNYIIYNTENVKEFLKYKQDSIVVYPYCPVHYYRTPTTKKYVTLINHNLLKGGDLLIELAKAMPDVQFCGVAGGYFEQLRDYSVKNITYLPATHRIKDIYADTSILLMPSMNESFGRCAIEAACSGIPTIAHPTDGLQEALGDKGIYCNRNNIEEWITEIRKLLSDAEYYELQSKTAFERAKTLEQITDMQMQELEQMMLQKAELTESLKEKRIHEYKSKVYGCK